MAHSARHDDHVVNFELLRTTVDAFHKFAFVPGGDPAMAGAPPGDPAAGSAPPMDPAAMGGGAPPMDPAAMGMGGGGAPPAPGGDPLSAILQKLNELTQAGGAGGAAGAAGAGGAIKPKIDVNAVLLQILKIQARIADSLGIQIPASEMVPGQADMQQLAQATQSGQPMPGMDPTAQVGGAPPAGAIAPIGPMPGAGVPGQDKAGSRFEPGRAFDAGTTFDRLGDRVAAVAALFRAGAAR